MKRASTSFLILFISALTVLAYPTKNEHQQWTNPAINEHVTVTFYTAQDCPEDKKVVLACQDEFSKAKGFDLKTKEPTCVSGNFASYQLTTSHNNMLSLGKIGVSEGQDQCNFESGQKVKTFKGRSILGSISGGCHNLAQSKGDENFLGAHSGKVYTYQCTKSNSSINNKDWIDQNWPPKIGQTIPGTKKRAESSDFHDGWLRNDDVSDLAKRGWVEDETKPADGQSNAWYLEGSISNQGTSQIQANPIPNKNGKVKPAKLG